jgi:hypothetical protein
MMTRVDAAAQPVTHGIRQSWTARQLRPASSVTRCRTSVSSPAPTLQLLPLCTGSSYSYRNVVTTARLAVTSSALMG